ncbi:Homeodomain-like superfamily protein [Theobroma cacao]|uniref:Homeodomain-like superfamily protein n=1 Tax=Theobroma cacao TaxID=3641 RepID=A0A061DUW2_THECC|nr:Homeodomain-like superfamily protein [Theobroma cacao]
MVSVNPNPAQGFYFFDPMNMGLPGLKTLPPANTVAPPHPPPANSMSTSTAGNTAPYSEDPSKKVRKPYTITKSRESWTEQEHDKFLEALQLFDRDWKKIEAFVGSKTVIQIRSHAQKYFLKVQKNGTSEHVPPPRPKRKASHPYPQKAPKSAPVVSQAAGPFQSSAALLESGYTFRPDSSSVLGNPVATASLSSWSYNSVPTVAMSQATKDDAVLAGPTVAHNACYSSSNESTPRTWSFGEAIDLGDHGKKSRVIPDFSQVYSFIGSVFDPSASGHLQKLKQMDPINLETVLLLMRNLSVNLTSPEFEDHRRLLSSYDAESERVKLGSSYKDIHTRKSASAVPTA